VRRLAAALTIPWALVACGHALPTPPTGPHVNEEPVEVPYPPPAARVDVIPLSPLDMKHPVWIDGQWLWRGRRWVWEAGQWADLGPGQFYARPTVQYVADGRLMWFPGSLRVDTSASAPAKRP
jgi:hypothetical protein